MEHEGNIGTNHASVCRRHGDGRGERIDSDYSLQSCATMPATVLVTELDDGTFVLQGRPDGPRVWLDPPEAGPLKRELLAAFDCGKSAQ